ncbi:hypothetical protein FRACYDRAFT_250798 [Fragilariopsis cylindrus CCMP1102]|uniref:Uncharacterized protein n=1 Tax=Fragilariopsis cylindrus CCMP1102 TaxID=635003 RepID=A0A1E7EP98_9STRA|nr:hypothetical protein FRACYDRAFT_250798 [Fragilariopsis cylindrus CCMP1102]|eukprot:OEU07771.1 hypothetical protein FRACYDRAFT_250798 [Fragilariopsis cylindrus CCMP1102]
MPTQDSSILCGFRMPLSQQQQQHQQQQQQQQQQTTTTTTPTPTQRRPRPSSWATKNASGFHGNTAPGRMRLLDRALFLLQIPPFIALLTKQQQQQQLSLSLLSRKLFAWQQDNKDDVGMRNNTSTTVNNGIVVDVDVAVVVVVVDVGIGDDPATTIEFATALEQQQQQQQQSGSMMTTRTPSSSSVLIIGTEVDADRLQHAEAVLYNSSSSSSSSCCNNNAKKDVLAKISLRLGTTDFCLPLLKYYQPEDELQIQHHQQQQQQNNEQIQQQQQQQRPQLLLLVRAMNVLRDYPVPDAIVALRKLYQQLSPGGIVVEGSADTEGRIVVALVLHKPQHEQEENDDEKEEEDEIYIAAVIFAADLEALELDPDYATSSPAKWFNRHNHLPRLYRSYCDTSECSCDEVPMWVAPMRSFLERWEDATTTATTTTTTTIIDATTTDTKDDEEEKEEEWTTTTTTKERFRNSVLTLKEVQEEEERSDTVVTDWVEEGIVVWVPGEKKLPLPDLEEWNYYRQRTVR